MTIQFLFGVCDSLDALGSRCGAQPSGDDGIVALTKRGKKLLASDGNALIRHCVPPANPVEFF
jgi:hypothetical protein